MGPDPGNDPATSGPLPPALDAGGWPAPESHYGAPPAMVPGAGIGVDSGVDSGARPREPWITAGELRAGAVLFAVLVVTGVIAGAIWTAWSRTPTRGLVYTAHAIIPDETEGFISSDGRFVIITAVIGLAAGLLAWSRRAHRGPAMVAALGLGSAAGALLTDLVGRLFSGGKDTGKLGTLLARLPLEVHATGLLFVEGVLAVGIYTLCAMVVAPDDLDRGVPPDRLPAADSDALVDAGLDVERAGRNGDAARSG